MAQGRPTGPGLVDVNAGGTITVFGGTGYLGRHVARMLARAGLPVRVAVRHPRPGLFEDGSVRQISADVRDPSTVAGAIGDATAVVNAVGLYVERGPNSFQAIHVDGARCVAEQAAAAHARLVHISGIGASPASASRYVRARAAGEDLVKEHAPHAVILRPSVLFGAQDSFLTTLAKMIRVAPVVPLFGAGSTRMQPVYVDDVARAVTAALTGAVDAAGIYELGGPKVYTYRQVIEVLMDYLGKRRILLPVPYALWQAQAAVASLLPSPPLTRDQVELMRLDNTVSPAALGFRALHIDPRPLESLLPHCLPPTSR